MKQTMKNNYVQPQMEVVMLQSRTTLLAGSGSGGGTGDEEVGSPEFSEEDFSNPESLINTIINL